MIDRRLLRGLVPALAAVLLSACAALQSPGTAPVPAATPAAPAAVTARDGAAVHPAAGSTIRHSTAAGPPVGFVRTQVLTSVVDVRWEGDYSGQGRIDSALHSGMRLIVRFEVIDRLQSVAVIKASLQTTEVLRDGAFVPAPFLQFNPPREVTFKVNYRMRRVDFSPAEAAFDSWSKSLRGGPAAEIVSPAFVREHVASLKDLFGRTALDFAGNTYSFRLAITEKKPFFVPLAGPGLTLGPLDVDLASTLRYVEVNRGRKIFRVTGGQSSSFMRLDASGLSARMAALKLPVPPVFESEGALRGATEAQVDADSGWITDLESDFTSVITCTFYGGTLTETVKGRRTVVTLP